MNFLNRQRRKKPVSNKSTAKAVNTSEVANWYHQNEQTFIDFYNRGITAKCPSFPTNVFIEPVNACNMECPFCTTILETRPRRLMSLDILEKFLNDMSRAKIYPRLTFTGEGEPFLHKDICTMIEMSRAKGFNTWTISNGSMLTPDRTERLIKTGINRVQFSIDSVVRKTYDSMRVAKGKRESYYDQVMGNILHFIKRNFECGSPTFVTVSSVQTWQNEHEEQDFRDYWMGLPVNHVFIQPQSTIQGSNPSGESQGLFFKGEQKDKPVCAIPFGNAKVNSNGDVNLCTHDYNGVYAVGNVKNSTFQEIWNNEKSQLLRQALIDGKVQGFVDMGHDCAKCNNPLIGYGMDDYRKDSDVRLTRLLSALQEKTAVREPRQKYKNVLSEIDKFPLANQ